MSDVTVRLRDGSPLTHFADQSTYLVVTAEPQTVDASRVGPACRACREVVIEACPEPVEGAAEPTPGPAFVIDLDQARGVDPLTAAEVAAPTVTSPAPADSTGRQTKRKE